MSRTAYELRVPDFDRALQTVVGVLQKNGFKSKQKNGENYWQLGSGFWTAAKYVSIQRTGDHDLVLHAWIKPFMSAETSLDHKFAGAIPIKQLKKVMDEILAALGIQV